MNDLTRPIIGIENRTAQEVFDIMCDRLRAASTPPAPEHPDDLAVDRFAATMKTKLKWEREERGRSGWQNMTEADLSRLLVEHLPKGDPVDVANFCMMLSENGQCIQPAPERSKEEVGQNERLNLHKKVLGMIRDKQRYAGAILDGRELHVIAEALLDRAIETEKAASLHKGEAREYGWAPELDAVVAVAKDMAEYITGKRPSAEVAQKAALFLCGCIGKGALSPLYASPAPLPVTVTPDPAFLHGVCDSLRAAISEYEDRGLYPGARKIMQAQIDTLTAALSKPGDQ